VTATFKIFGDEHEDAEETFTLFGNSIPSLGRVYGAATYAADVGISRGGNSACGSNVYARTQVAAD
jgi:hypothetical protein